MKSRSKLRQPIPNQNHKRDLIPYRLLGAEEPAPAPSTPDIVAENEAFRIFEPKPDTIVDKTLKVSGEQLVFSKQC